MILALNIQHRTPPLRTLQRPPHPPAFIYLKNLFTPLHLSAFFPPSLLQPPWREPLADRSLSYKRQQENTAVLGGSGDTCDSEERGQAEQGRGLLVCCGTVGDALLYERQAV